MKNILSPAITARYVRIHPVSWTSWISMRIELYGCYRGTVFDCKYKVVELYKVVLYFLPIEHNILLRKFLRSTLSTMVVKHIKEYFSNCIVASSHQ